MELDDYGQADIVLLRNSIGVWWLEELLPRSPCPWHAAALVAWHDCSRRRTWVLDTKSSDHEETRFRLWIYSSRRRGRIPALVLLPTPNRLHFLRDRLRALCRLSAGLLRENVLGRPALAAETDDHHWNFGSPDRPEFSLLLADIQWLGSAIQPMELPDVAALLGLGMHRISA